MKRSISTFALLLTSISAIIGSGWLFSAYYTSSIAGPAALISWVLGGIFVAIVAFVFSEICGMLPITGSSARIPQFTHGTMVSFMFAWMIWLSYLSLMATEVQAVIQYASFYLPSLIKNNGGLTDSGYVTALILMFLISLINTYSIRWLIRCNNTLTIIKIIIPIVIVGLILFCYFAPHELTHPAGRAFMPTGIKGIVGAISTGGIVFAFNGFKQAAEMAGDAKNPGRSVPIAILGSVGFCLILFLLIQLAFLSSLQNENLADGWAHIHLQDNNSPLAAIMSQDHLNYLLPLLYFGAIVAPLAAALMYCSSAARSLFGMSKNGYLPVFFQQLSPRGNPMGAVIVNFVLALLLFAPLPGWNNMVAFLTSLLALTYSVGPVCLLTLRAQAPLQKRYLRLPCVRLWAFASFYICTLLAYWSGWEVLSKMGFAVLIGLILLFAYRLISQKTFTLNLKESLWMWLYFVGLILISYFGDFGGRAILSFEQNLGVIAVFCAFILWVAYRFKLPSEETIAYINALQLERDDDRS